MCGNKSVLSQGFCSVGIKCIGIAFLCRGGVGTSINGVEHNSKLFASQLVRSISKQLAGIAQAVGSRCSAISNGVGISSLSLLCGIDALVAVGYLQGNVASFSLLLS